MIASYQDTFVFKNTFRHGQSHNISYFKKTDSLHDEVDANQKPNNNATADREWQLRIWVSSKK